MALADPQDIVISGSTISLPRTNTGNNSSTYTSADGLVKETLSHQYGKNNRHLFRVDHSKIAADPFQSTLNAKYKMATYVVIDVPPVGYTVAEAKAVVDGMLAELTASTGALITKLIGGES